MYAEEVRVSKAKGMEGQQLAPKSCRSRNLSAAPGILTGESAGVTGAPLGPSAGTPSSRPSPSPSLPTYRSKNTLRLPRGPTAPEEAHGHHQGPCSNQHIQPCGERTEKMLTSHDGLSPAPMLPAWPLSPPPQTSCLAEPSVVNR